MSKSSLTRFLFIYFLDLPEPPPDYNSAISLNSHPKGFSNSTSSLSSTELSFSGQQTHFSTSLPSQSSNLIAMGTGCISRSGHRDMLSGSRLPVDIPTQTVPSGALSEPIVDTAEISPVDIKEDGIFLSSPSISVPIQNCSPIGTVPVPTRDVMVPVAENMSHVKLVISKLGGSVDRGFCYPKQSGVNKSQESLKPVPVAVDNSGNRDVKGRILQSKSGAGNVLRTEGECYSGGDFLPSNNNIVGASNLEEVLEINKAEMATAHQSDKEEKLEYPIISRLSRHSASRIPMRGLSSGRWPAIGACDPIKMQRQSFAPLSEVNWDSRSEEFWAPLFSIFP
ncbi:unnamed protein product [Protopolystoma xenopodis]|uniref:Uncharacterized protein n=1 Tax=Protopolystoma xenopodis TaxID=117903 RepID=A0A3S5A9W4_9PLAT|nr:unnamed protein product [Protopolystoma xenopodis]